MTKRRRPLLAVQLAIFAGLAAGLGCEGEGTMPPSAAGTPCADEGKIKIRMLALDRAHAVIEDWRKLYLEGAALSRARDKQEQEAVEKSQAARILNVDRIIAETERDQRLRDELIKSFGAGCGPIFDKAMEGIQKLADPNDSPIQDFFWKR